jgi:NitT/TauT family transport system permease protein
MNDISKYARRYALIILVHLGVVIIWWLWVKMGEIPEEYGWVHNTYITAMEVFGGYFLAVVAGVGLALIFTWFKVVETLFMPLMVSLNMIPKVALGPLFIVWMSYGVGTKIQLPGSLPYLFSGMKVAVVLAVAGAIVGEFIASEEGLGYLMLQVQVTLDTAAMFMAVLLITGIGVILYALVLLLEYLFIGHAPKEI